MDIQQDTLQKIDKLQLHETENESLLNGHHVVASSSTANGGHLSDIDGKSEVSEKSQKSTQRTNGSGSGVGSSTTKVCYHIDDEPTPYVTHVPVPPDQITLLDFKQMLNKTNYKFYCKSNDPEVGGEVKAEIRDDTQRLFRGSNGQFELFLLTTDGSNNSDGASSGFSKNIRQMVPGPAPSSYPFNMPHVRHFPGFDHGHRRRAFEDSTICTESDAKVFSDDESRVSTSTDNITSVSRQHNNYRVRQRRMRRHLRQPSRASSMSSMTETSMSLEVMTVTLNMDSVNFLGISIVGQSSTGGDNGIYVANIMKGGAVALDGRIEPGDMILQVNDVSFENFTNDQAVEVLKEAVSRRGPIKLTVAKSWDSTRQDFFALPTKEPVRPIDMRAWIQHTNAANNLPHIPEGSEGAPTPIPGQYPNYGRAHSSSTATSNGSGQQTIIGPNGQIFILPKKLDTSTDKKRVVCAMALPNSGLEIKDRTWLEILFPMSFLGSDLIDWLMTYVEGLNDRKDAKKYAADLLKEGHITHMVNDKKFNKQSYYMIGPNCADVVRLRLSEESTSRTDINSLPAPPPTIPQTWQNNAMSNGDYLPISPFPMHYQRGPDMYSQVSGHSTADSGGSSKYILPPAPIVPYHAGAQFFRQQTARLNDFPKNLAASRQSFRIACGNQTSEEFFIENV